MGYKILVNTYITEDRLFTGSIYKFATVCDITMYIQDIFHCNDLNKATAVVNRCNRRENCFPSTISIENDYLSFSTIILEFRDGTISELFEAEGDIFIEKHKDAEGFKMK